MSNDNILSVTGLSKHYGGVAALNACSLTVRRGSRTALIGPNGAGKTTLLSVIAGSVIQDSGTVLFDGHDISHLRPDERARLGLARTFQIARELGRLTVLENVLLAAAGSNDESALSALLRRGQLRRRQAEQIEKASELLNRAGIWHMANSPASDLSGGQKKLLELARALMLSPSLILLDEPAAGVAPTLVRAMIRFVQELSDSGIIEHDMRLIEELCDQVHVLAEGAPLISGTFAEVSSDERVLSAYLGTTHE